MVFVVTVQADRDRGESEVCKPESCPAPFSPSVSPSLPSLFSFTDFRNPRGVSCWGGVEGELRRTEEFHLKDMFVTTKPTPWLGGEISVIAGLDDNLVRMLWRL